MRLSCLIDQLVGVCSDRQKKKGLGTGSTKGGGGTGQDKKGGGSVPRHIPMLDILYMSVTPSFGHIGEYLGFILKKCSCHVLRVKETIWVNHKTIHDGNTLSLYSHNCVLNAICTICLNIRGSSSRSM